MTAHDRTSGAQLLGNKIEVIVNHAPVANGETLSGTEDTTSTYTAAQLLVNDTDADGNTLTIRSVTAIAGGSVTLNANGTITFVPDANFHGNATFSYIATDGKPVDGDSLAATVTITVASVNDAPVTTGQSVTTAEDTNVNITLSASDVDGDTLTYTIVGSPAHGSLTGTAPNYVYTPDTNYNGSDTFTFKVNDGTVDSATVTVLINVTPVNDAPTIAAPVSLPSSNEDTSRVISLAQLLTGATDPEGQSLSVTGLVASNGTLVYNGDATWTYTPAANFTGLETLTYGVSDGVAAAVITSATFNVSPVNDTPVANAQSVTTAEDTAVDITLTGSDVDGNPLTYSVVGSPAHGTLTGTAPNLTYTPGTNYNGSDTFTFKVNDGTVDSATVTVTIGVTPVNDTPVATDDSFTTSEDTTLNASVAGGLLSNDVDIDGPALTVTQVNGLSTNVGVPVTLTKGVLTVQANGSFLFVPNANAFGSETFSYTASDGSATDTADVLITIVPVNDVPVANGQSVSTAEDNALSITLTGSDVEGSTLTYTVVGSPAHGALSGTAPNLTYTPALNYNGPDSFTFKVNDGAVDSATVTVSINVSPVNDAPTVSGVVTLASSGEDTGRVITLAQLLTNAIDVDGQSLSVVSLSASNGTIVYNGDQTWTFTPALNFNGSVVLAYSVTDGVAPPVAAGAGFSVLPVNDAPVAVNDTATVAEDALAGVAISVLGNDSDIDSSIDQTTLIAGGAANGTVTVNTSTGVVTYVPNTNFFGTDTFTYTVKDTAAATSNSATVTVTVTPVNDAPTFTLGSAPTVNEDSGTHVFPSFLSAASVGPANENGQLLTLSVTNSNNPLFAIQPVIDLATGTLQFTLAPNASGSATVTVTLSDNGGGTNSTTQNFVITVTPVNDAPVANNDTATVTEDSLVGVAIDVVANDTDIDGTVNVTTVVASAPAHGSVVVNPTTGVVTYTPSANFSGTDTFTYTVKDNSGTTSNVATVTVSVTAQNDAPVAVDDTVAATANAVANFNVLANDTDVDGDTLTVTKINNAAIPLSGSVTLAGQGTLQVNANGQISFTPVANFTGAATFQYTVGDGHGGEDDGTVTINVASIGSNTAPDAKDDAFTTDEDTPFTGNVIAGASPTVGDDDIDADGDQLTTVLLTQPSSGLATVGFVTMLGDGAFTFTPNGNFTGEAKFTYRLLDGRGGSDTATVTMTVNSVNDAPSGADKSITVTETPDVASTGHVLSVADFGFTDTGDTPANALSAVKITTLPTTGTLKLNNVNVTAGQDIPLASITGNLLKFHPALNTFGSAVSNFTFQVIDDGATGGANVNTDPTANTITYQVTSTDAIPPTISGVFVNSSAWNSVFRDFADGEFADPKARGYKIPTGSNSQMLTLPWVNINQITIQFSENVGASLDASDFLLTASVAGIRADGSTAAIPRVSSVSFNSTTFVATLVLSQSIEASIINLQVLASGVRDVSGNMLDGEWVNSSSTASGNGTAGGDFSFQFNVLPGKAVQVLPSGNYSNATVDFNPDGLAIINAQPGFIEDGFVEAPYTIFADLNGSGESVDSIDLDLMIRRRFSKLLAP